jgi:elongation factor P hydroxylase
MKISCQFLKRTNTRRVNVDYNPKYLPMAIGGWSERIVYSTGAMAGALSGLWVGNLIL